MMANVTKTIDRFSDISLHCRKLNEFLLMFVKCFSDSSLHCGKLNEFLLKFVNVLVTLVIIIVSLTMKTNVT
jgi:hypothetical protein